MNKEKAKEITLLLSECYPNAKPALKFSTPYELLIAVMLSAQCTDERVNKVTEKLFKNFNTPKKMITLSQEELSSKIYECGLNNIKARHILDTSKALVNDYGGEVPSSLETLQTLPGVGRKTANVVYSVAFHGDAIAVDTHVFRVSRRLGLSSGSTPLKVEKDLMELIDKSEWSKCHHYLIWHGRKICKSQNPDCLGCKLSGLCENKGKL